MKPNDDLFALIRSMTPQEKRHFKLLASRYRSEKSYLKLFDAIDAQTEYDEEALRLQFGEEAFIRQLHVAKNYLYRLIMRSLQMGNAGENLANRVAQKLRTVEILHSRMLFDQAWRHLRSARKLAEKGELNLALLNVAGLERKLHSEALFRKISQEEIGRWEIDARDRADDIAAECRAAAHYALAAKRFVELGTARSQPVREEFEEMLRKGEMMEKETRTLRERIHLLRARQMAHDMLGNNQESFDTTRELVRLFDEHPDFREAHLGEYIPAVNNYHALSLRLRHLENFLESLETLRRLQTRSLRQQLRIAEHSYSQELWYYIYTGEFERAAERLPEITAALSRFGDALSDKARLFLQYHSGYIYFALGNYDRSIEALNVIFNDLPPTVRTDLHCFTRIIALMVHYERGADDLMEYMLRSLYRYLLRKGMLHRFERRFLSFIRDLGKARSKTETLAMFQSLGRDLETLASDPDERYGLDYFDFGSWIESKLTKESFARTARRRYLESTASPVPAPRVRG